MLCLLILAAFQDATVTASGVSLDLENGHTIVPIRVEVQDRSLVQFEKTAQMIASFEDDKGDDLKLGTPHWEWHRNPEITRNGRVCTMELVATNLPHEDAKTVKITGTLTFTAASGRETYRELVPIAKDASGHIGEIPYEIRNIRPDVGSPTKTVQIMYFGITRERSALIGIDYFTEDGSEVDDRDVRFQYNKTGYLVYLKLPREATAFEAEIEQWLDHEIVEAPYELTLDL